MKHQEDNLYFHYYNANPKDRNVDDCTFRAFSLFLDMSWEDFARFYGKYYLETGELLNNHVKKNVQSVYTTEFERYALEHGLCQLIPDDEAFPDPGIYRPGKHTLKTFIDYYAKEDEVYLVKFPGHVTVVKDKKIWDTSDCSRWSPSFIYKKTSC